MHSYSRRVPPLVCPYFVELMRILPDFPGLFLRCGFFHSLNQITQCADILWCNCFGVYAVLFELFEFLLDGESKNAY
jgi:hypothetical protein